MKISVVSIFILIWFFSSEVFAQWNESQESFKHDLIRIMHIDSTNMMYYYWIEAFSEDNDSIVILSKKQNSVSKLNVTECIELDSQYKLNLSYVNGFSDLPGIVNDSLSLSLIRLYEHDIFYVEHYMDGKNKRFHCLDFPMKNIYYTSSDLFGICLQEE